MTDQIKGIGFNAHRLKSDINHEERCFVAEWQETISSSPNGRGSAILKHLLPFPSPDDEIAIETVIQWLGSNVGQAFLQRVQNRIDGENNETY